MSDITEIRRKNAWAALLAASMEISPKEIWEANPADPAFQDRVAAAMSQWGGPNTPLERIVPLADRFYPLLDSSEGDLCRKIHGIFHVRPNFLQEIQTQRGVGSGSACVSSPRTTEYKPLTPPAGSEEKKTAGASVGPWRTAPYKPLNWSTPQKKGTFGGLKRVPDYRPLEWESIRIAREEAAKRAEEERKKRLGVGTRGVFFRPARPSTHQPISWSTGAAS